MLIMLRSYYLNLEYLFCLVWFLRQVSLFNSPGCPGTSSCRPGWSWTHRDSSVSASQVLGLNVCAPPLPGWIWNILTLPYVWLSWNCSFNKITNVAILIRRRHTGYVIFLSYTGFSNKVIVRGRTKQVIKINTAAILSKHLSNWQIRQWLFGNRVFNFFFPTQILSLTLLSFWA